MNTQSSQGKLTLISPISELFVSAWERIEQRTGRPEIEITFHQKLNNRLWGLHREEMLILGARTSQGKSSLALQIAYDVAKQGKRVFFLSLEMSCEALVERLFCQVKRIPNYELFTNPDKYMGKAKEFREEIETLPLIITYKIGSTIKELYQVIEDLPQPDCVIVDYIQAIRSVSFDKLSEMNDYILRFRELCVKKNFAGILVSQINRGAMDHESKEPKMWQLKSSGLLEEHADTVLLCHYPSFYPGAASSSEYEIIIAKQRNGVTGKIQATFEPQYYLIKEVNPQRG